MTCARSSRPCLSGDWSPWLAYLTERANVRAAAATAGVLRCAHRALLPVSADAADLELSVDFEATSTRADVSAELRVPPLGSGREDKPAVLCATLSKVRLALAPLRSLLPVILV